MANRQVWRRSPVRTLVSIGALALALWLFLPQILTLFSSGPAVQIDASASQALAELSQLEVAAPTVLSDAPPYSRDQFGGGWADLDGDNCNTRNEILARDLEDVTYRPNTNDCVVMGGTLIDPYTATTIVFERGPQTSEAVQIDHVVALADGWQAGAWQWSPEERLMFANDPLNLLAVDGPANQRKGAATADQWVPDNQEYHCQYAARQVAIKYKWNLSVTQAEQAALNRILSGCPEVTFIE